MKFSQLKKGKRAVRTVELPLVGEPGDRNSVTVGLRVLAAEESSDILKAARAFAVEGGVKDPKPDDALYQLGIRIHTVFTACVDSDFVGDPASDEARFFSSLKELMSSPEIGDDGVSFLYEHWLAWQDACSPQPTKMGEAEFWAKVSEVALSDDPLVCVQWRPATLASFVRSMAQALLTSLTLKSEPGSPSESNTESSKTSTESPEESNEAEA